MTPDILLVEDNADDVALIERALRKNGIAATMQTARDGREALDVLLPRDSAHAAGPRLVLLDLKMPRVGGLEVLRQLRADERTKRLPVVVLTSSLEPRDIHDAYGAGANSYLRKPVDFTEFMDLVRKLADYWLARNQAPPSPEAFPWSKP